MSLLELQNIQTFYGSIQALHGVSLDINQNEIVTLIGANGAGKSTTLRTVSGLLRPRFGRVVFEGKAIHERPPHEIVSLGISQVPEGRRIFPRMTVKENLEMGAFARADKSGIAADMERVLALFPRLKERLAQRGGTLSGGEQQMLAISRALMSSPRILLLDEPSMGLAPILVETIFDTLREIHKQGGTILLVEQNALMALEIAHRGYVLESGRVVLHGTAADLRNNEAVQRSYLGIE
jgi:branched-chain amino acid transport system ATP-binding protein